MWPLPRRRVRIAACANDTVVRLHGMVMSTRVLSCENQRVLVCRRGPNKHFESRSNIVAFNSNTNLTPVEADHKCFHHRLSLLQGRGCDASTRADDTPGNLLDTGGHQHKYAHAICRALACTKARLVRVLTLPCCTGLTNCKRVFTWQSDT